MNSSATIILPGLDGTGVLLEEFAAHGPATHSVQVQPLPDDPTDDYGSLCDKLSIRVQEFGSCHLIAESFSGPLGILLAHRHPKIVERLTLVATFATSPAPFAARLVPWSLFFRLPMPSLIARYFLAGQNPPLVNDLKQAVGQTSPRTLARRMRCLIDVDVTQELRELECDITYLRAKHDRLVRKRSLKTITNANPNVSVCEIDGPHLILQTRPEQAWECILDGNS